MDLNQCQLSMGMSGDFELAVRNVLCVGINFIYIDFYCKCVMNSACHDC